MNNTFRISRDGTLCLALVMITFVAFWQVRSHEFVHYDDDRYVFENRHVQGGLTRENVVWAFTTGHATNWHPVTWLSHQLDCQLFGLNAGAHHTTNLLLHAANTVLLFLVLRRMTGATYKSAFVAALFAVHPLHVESVAWVAERKDVLSTLFWLLTMWAYVRYVHTPGVWRYMSVIALFALGLMAKPMLVTLPFVLLLLDYWPLGRVGDIVSGAEKKVRAYSRLVYEKIPLFALAAGSCVVTLIVQRHGGALKALETYPLDVRVANAGLAYAAYIGKMLLPRRLAVLYPHPGAVVPLWRIAGAVVLLGCVSAMVFRLRRRAPYLLTGWLWYVGTLVPVIGIVQVGSQAMADRYTYVPLVGLFIMLAWGVPELVPRRPYRKVALGVPATASIMAMAVCTWFQVGLWRDSITLFEHTLRVTSNNPVIHNSFGNALADQGRLDEAVGHYTEAIRFRRNYAEAHYNLGIALVEQGRYDEAALEYTEAVRIEPDNVDAHNNLGSALARQGKLDAAIAEFYAAIRLDPAYAKAHYNVGLVLIGQGKLDAAIVELAEAIRLEPKYADAYAGLGAALEKQGNLDDAVARYSKALALDPNNVSARKNLERIGTNQIKPHGRGTAQ